jgi:hypothetical protein
MAVIKKILDVEALNTQLQEGEKLKFLFVINATPIEKDKGEQYTCKNGHWNFISNYMGFEPNTHVQIKCNECDEIIFEFKPFAIRTRELDCEIVSHSCKTCKELSQTFHPDDDWFCRKKHVGFNIGKTNDCPDYDKKEQQ